MDSKKTAIGDSRWQEIADPSKWPSYEIYPATAWNYALDLNADNIFVDFIVEKRPWPKDDFPFKQEVSPIIVKATGRQVPSWTLGKYKLCGMLPDEDCCSVLKYVDIKNIFMDKELNSNYVRRTQEDYSLSFKLRAVNEIESASLAYMQKQSLGEQLEFQQDKAIMFDT